MQFRETRQGAPANDQSAAPCRARDADVTNLVEMLDVRVDLLGKLVVLLRVLSVDAEDAAVDLRGA